MGCTEGQELDGHTVRDWPGRCVCWLPLSALGQSVLIVRKEQLQMGESWGRSLKSMGFYVENCPWSPAS